MARLEENLRDVRERIAAAARAAGRDPASVALLAVSKTWPADDVRTLAALGQRDFGENRAQELVSKAVELAEPADPSGPPSAGTSSGSSSGTRPPRSRASAPSSTPSTGGPWPTSSTGPGRESGRPVEVLLQVDLGGTAAGAAPRGGAAPEEIPELADAGGRAAGLRLRGLMAVAPRGEDPAPAFERLAAARGPGQGRPSRGRRAVRGHERGHGGRDRGGRDDRACRNRVVRRSAPTLRRNRSSPAPRVTGASAHNRRSLTSAVQKRR